MPPEAGARVEWLKAEGFRARGADNLPDVHAHPVEDDLHLVYEGYVHRPVYVLEELRAFCDPRGGDGHGGDHHLAVEVVDHGQAPFGDSRDDLGNGAGCVFPVARVFPLRAVPQEEVTAHGQPRLEKEGQHLLVCRSRIGGALQYHHMAFSQMLPDLQGRVDYVGQVGLPVSSKGRGNAEYDRIDGGQAAEIIRRFEHPLLPVFFDERRRYVLYVGDAPVQPAYLLRVDIEARDAEIGEEEFPGQGEPHIPHADYSHHRLFPLDLPDEFPVRHDFPPALFHHIFFILSRILPDLRERLPSLSAPGGRKCILLRIHRSIKADEGQNFK